jgi:peptidoglycan/LPS O-acetylase OafA/YrhL
MNKNISYLPKIDALQAIAAFMVLIAHYLEDLNSSISFAYGRNGIQIFFTISGFLITLILLTQKNNNTELPIKKLIISFMFKRAFRLFPIYYILIITLLIFSILGGLWICEPHNEWYYFIYAQNYLFYKIGFQSNLLNHTWSLAV